MNAIRPNSLALIRNHDSVLAVKGVDKNSGKIFFRLLGGGIEFGETSFEALAREFREELAATITNEELLCTIENIFEFNGKQGHEITFLYKADFQDEQLYDQLSIPVLDKENTFAEWVLTENILTGEAILYPAEAAQYL